MNTILIRNTTAFFTKRFETAPDKTVLSPGRINIIGEHIDYNDGFVLPAAIDKMICFGFRKNDSGVCRIAAIDLDDETELTISADIEHSPKDWANYLIGVLGQLRLRGLDIHGFDCAFSSNIPIGSGLSSSAALECGFLYGINALFDLGLHRVEIAQMGQKAEHWVGVNCGIMDQFANMLGSKNKVIQIDCRSLDYEYHNADFSGYSLLLFDSNVKHSLFSSAYNQRRKECEHGLEVIRTAFPDVSTFRDCTQSHLDFVKDELSGDVFRRCHYVIAEIDRVFKACDALDRGDLITLGRLMFETHRGLSEDYEVSCGEIDFLVEGARSHESVIGSRMMGGGFGGCTINLIRKGFEETVKTELSDRYLQKFNIALKIYDVKIADGTSLA